MTDIRMMLGIVNNIFFCFTFIILVINSYPIMFCPNRYARSKASVVLMSPLSFTPLTSTMPASSIWKKLRVSRYWVTIASNSSGRVDAPTNSRARHRIGKWFRSGVCSRSITAFSWALMP